MLLLSYSIIYYLLFPTHLFFDLEMTSNRFILIFWNQDNIFLVDLNHTTMNENIYSSIYYKSI